MTPQMLEIKQKDCNEHIFIVINCSNRPAISIDLMNKHGRRGISIRIDGMGIFNALIDLKELSPLSSKEVLDRYCSLCGEKLNLLSSSGHHCKT